MSNHYTGNRYVPKILGDDDPWNILEQYESLVVVCYQGNSYTSRKNVPSGIDINNKDYWACTGNYDAQVEQYRQETQNAVINVNNKLDGFSNLQDGKFEIMLNNYKTEVNTYTDAKYADINTEIDNVNDNLQSSKNNINATMAGYETSVQQSIDGYTNTVNNQMTQIQAMLQTIDLVYDEGTSTDVDGSDITIIDEGVV